MKMLYAVTHLNKDGVRVLTFGNWGQHHKKTKAEAKRDMANYLKNNSHDLLVSVMGEKGIASLKVKRIKCYDHGEAIHSYNV